MTQANSIDLELNATYPVIFLRGEITGEIEEELRQAWSKVSELSVGKVVLDLHEAEYINSSGIALLIELSHEAQSQNRYLVLSGLTRQLRKVLELVGLLEFLQTYDSLEAALSS